MRTPSASLRRVFEAEALRAPAGFTVVSEVEVAVAVAVEVAVAVAVEVGHRPHRAATGALAPTSPRTRVEVSPNPGSHAPGI